ncbi:MAG TPA: NAD-dependent epimerase/dehydratase family protein, partial [Longimicrobiales bacterium]
MNRDDRVFVAGHRGMVGSAIVRRLEADGYTNILVQPRDQLDLADATAVRRYFEDAKPDYVF